MALTPMPQSLRQTQLSASNAHAQAQHDARNPSSSVSKSRKSRSSRTANPPTADSEIRIELETIATKLFILCVPWSEQWAVYRSWIVRAPTDEEQCKLFQHQRITGTDDLGIEILSYIPRHLVSEFLSQAGQSVVSLSSWTSMLTTT